MQTQELEQNIIDCILYTCIGQNNVTNVNLHEAARRQWFAHLYGAHYSVLAVWCSWTHCAWQQIR